MEKSQTEQADQVSAVDDWKGMRESMRESMRRWKGMRESMRRREHQLRERAVALGYFLVGALDVDHLAYPSFAIFWKSARINTHPLTLGQVDAWLDQAQDVRPQAVEERPSKAMEERAAAEGLLLRASNGAFDVLLDPEVCVDPDGRQWMLRNADLREVGAWFEDWDELRRHSAAAEAKLARLIPEEIRNDAEGINGCGDSDGRGHSPSSPWASGEPTLEEVPSNGGEEMP